MTRQRDSSGEQGFMLVGLIVAIAIILLVLGIAAPKVARSLRRDQEVEAVHRGNQYVRAIQVYYRKFGHYPPSMDALEKSNNIRFLRERYGDPTNHDLAFRLIPVGQNQTTVKGFFGEPLAGIANQGLGALAGNQSAGIPGPSGANAAAGAFGGASASAAAGGSSAPSFGPGASNGASGIASAAGTTGIGGTGSAGGIGSTAAGTGTGTATGSGPASQSASSFAGSAQPFMGVGLNHTGESIVEPNAQAAYESWEFLYDPRIELLKQKAAALGGPATGAAGSGGFGQAPAGFGQSSGFGSTAPGSAPTSPGPGGPPPPPVPGVPGTPQ
jgi:type II secretory pathway pseudopilin PulG